MCRDYDAFRAAADAGNTYSHTFVSCLGENSGGGGGGGDDDDNIILRFGAAA